MNISHFDFEQLFILTGICIYGMRKNNIVWKLEYSMNERYKTERLLRLKEAAFYDDSEHVVQLDCGLSFLRYLSDQITVLFGPFFIEGYKAKSSSVILCGWPSSALRKIDLYEMPFFSNAFFSILSAPLSSDVYFDPKEFIPDSSMHSDTLETDRIFFNHQRESYILKLITHGMTSELKKEQFYSNSRYLPGHIYNYGLRTQKNLAITSNSLACRAAIRGGVPILFARSSCAHFVDQIEQADTMEALFQISNHLRTYYCQQVEKCQKEHFSLHVKSVIYRIKASPGKAPSLKKLAQEEGISPEHLSRLIKKESGQTYSQLLSQLRLEQAVFLLQNTKYSIIEITELVGFKNSSYFCSIFRKKFNISPQKYRSLSN